MCKFESSQKYESRWQSTDSSKAYRNTSAFKYAWSLLDLVLVSSSCASLCTCTVTSEFLGSDHPIVLTDVNANTTPEYHGVPKWNFSKADWQKFSAACDQTLTSFSISLSCVYCLFETSVREAALEAIPQSKKSLGIAVPWWNKQCDVAVKRKSMPSTE